MITLPKELTTVTPLSKTVALVMFISLPLIAFLFGMQYQMALTWQNKPLSPIENPIEEPVGCQEDAKICPDGSTVGRVSPNCEFDACPTTQKNIGKKFFGVVSSISYQCHMDGICSIGVGKASVIVGRGEGPSGEMPVRGAFPQEILNEDKKNIYLGKEVEVYAASSEGKTDSYTLFGNANYYLKFINETTATTDILFCGGIAGKVCPTNYYCKYEGSYPDAGGTCIKTGNIKPTIQKTAYICPKTQYVDCMPGPGPAKENCSSEYLQWAETNCPNFKGAAL